MRIRSYFLHLAIGPAYLFLCQKQESVRCPAQMCFVQGSADRAGEFHSRKADGRKCCVSAKKAGSHSSSITVVSDQHGRHAFPANKMEPGHYSLRIRAVGYDLDGLGTVEIAPQKKATADLKPCQTKDLASQLTNAEWILSVPGTEEQKS